MTPLTRRAFVTSALAGGGFALGFELFTGTFARADAVAALTFSPNAWLRVSSEGVLTFRLDRVEMGQGTMTALPMILAEELDVAPSDFIVEHAPAGREYLNPQMSMQMTGGSSSVSTAWQPLRRAGATARAKLVGAAAKRWGVPVTECGTKQKVVYHVASKRQAGYGDLAAEAAAFLVDEEQVILKDPKDFKVIGKHTCRLDARAKSTGAAEYGIDVAVPSMRVACVKRAPIFGAKVKSFDAEVARKMPGIDAVLEISAGVAVVASRFWQAKAAAAAVKVEWDLGPNQKLSSAELIADFAAAARAAADGNAEDKAVKAALAGAAKTLTAEYRTPYLAHAAMEPGNCAASVTADGCDVWAPTQAAGLAQQLAAEICDLPHDKVRIHTPFLGGGFGRRLYQDFVVEAVELAKLLGRPVRIQWTREDDMRHDFYRPATAHCVKGGVTSEGKIAAWAHVVAGQSILANSIDEWLRAIAPDWLPDGVKRASGAAAGGIFKMLGKDPTAIEGAQESPYSAPFFVEYVNKKAPVPVGFWRSVGHSHTGFVVESFVDELAALAGKDPLEFRRANLAADSKHLNVLNLAAEKSGWAGPPPAGRFRGIAVHESFKSIVAQVVEISVAGSEIKVHRVVCAVDCGRAVHPDGVEAQVQGAVIFALSAALMGEITIKDGAVVQSNFHEYPVLRANEVPQIEVHLVPSDDAPRGIGEPGVPPLAAALGNAIFAATGKRLRQLPFKLS